MHKRPECSKTKYFTWLIAVPVLFMLSTMVCFGQTQPVESEPVAKQSVEKQSAEPDLLTKMEQEAAGRQNALSAAQDKQEPIYITLLSFIFKLAVVVALAYGTIYALKRLNLGASKRSGSNLIKVIETTTLGPNRSLHLIETGDKAMLIASTPTQINLLSEIDVALDQPGEAGEAAVDEDGGGDSFSKRLSMCMGDAKDSESAAGSIAGLIRGSSAFLNEKIIELGRLRRMHKDARE